MKRALLLFLLLSSSMMFAQASGFGIKGGLNYGSVGDLEFTSEFAQNTFSKENKTGYHAGVFYKMKLAAGIFLQPEVLYTKLNTEYINNNPLVNEDPLNYEFSKIDIPLLVGVDVLGPIHLKGGPSFQYILDTAFEDIDIDFEDPEKSFTVGYQLGVGATLGSIGFDVRYEGAFQDNRIVSRTDVEDAGFSVDSRPSQWILSISYSFNNK